MKSKIILIALALFSAQASAEWELVSAPASGNKFFMDLSTKRQQGKYTLIWTLWNLPKAQLVNGKNFNSVRALDVYDCSGFRLGSKTEIYYVDISATGSAVEFYSREMNEIKFYDVAPGTVNETTFNKACGK